MFQQLLAAVEQAAARGASSAAAKSAVARSSVPGTSYVGNHVQSAMNAGFQIQSWADTFSRFFPSVTNAVTVTAIGKKGTPTKNAMHVALATAFGCMTREFPRIGDVALNIQIDHMNNAVQVEYAVRVSIIGHALANFLHDLNPFDGIQRGVTALAENPSPVVDWIIRRIKGGPLQLPFGGGGGAENMPKNPNPAGKNAPVIDNVLNGFLSFINLQFGQMIWSDPKSAGEARALGYIARESIEAGKPPALLSPPLIRNQNGNLAEGFPEPFHDMIKDPSNPRTIVTRFDSLPTNRIERGRANNPEPMVPATTESKAAWGYQKPPVSVPGVRPEHGYDFDLRALVAQALMDPTVNPPEPETYRKTTPK